MSDVISRRSLLAIAPLAVLASACSLLDDPTDPKQPKFTDGVGSLVHGNNQLDVSRPSTGDAKSAGACTVALAGKLAGAVGHAGSVLLSPASLAMPLAILANGARGESQSDLLELLGAADVDTLNTQCNAVTQALSDYSQKVETSRRKGEVKVQLANTLFAQQDKPVREDFLKASSTWFGTGMYGVDFAQREKSARIVNEWAAEHTHDRIKDLVSPDDFDEDTRLVIANALWFKAPWAKELVAETKMDFTRSDGRKVSTSQYRGDAMRWAMGVGWQLVTLNYLGDRFEMAFALSDTPDGEEAMVEQWAGGGLSKALGSLEHAEIDLRMPIWGYEQKHDLVAPLRKMGIAHLFAGQQVDLGGISDSEPLQVGAVVQKTWIEVDEKGTEAAAATAVVVGATSAPAGKEPPREIVLDRPFWYLVRDRETGTILFLGRMDDPKQ